MKGEKNVEPIKVDMFKQARQMGSWGQGVNITNKFTKKCFGMIDPSNVRTYPG